MPPHHRACGTYPGACPVRKWAGRHGACLAGLKCTRGKTQHGYAIAQEINRRSNNALNLKQGTLYPALHALERDGLVVSEWEVQEGERPRKIYQITEAGREEWARRTQAWSEFATAMQCVIGGPPNEQPALAPATPETRR